MPPIAAEDAVPLLWAHQLKREHRHLLQRIEAVESAAQSLVLSSNALPQKSSIHEAGSEITKENDETRDSVAQSTSSAIESLEARFLALEQRNQTLTNSLDTLRTSNETKVHQNLTPLEGRLQETIADLEKRLSSMQRERDELSTSVLSLANKLNTLDVEVSHDAVAVKNAGDIASGAQETLLELGNRIWAVENGMSNLESGAREDTERFGIVGGRLKTLDVRTMEAIEKIDRVFKVVEVLINRDDEVRGRLLALEAGRQGEDGGKRSGMASGGVQPLRRNSTSGTIYLQNVGQTKKANKPNDWEQDQATYDKQQPPQTEYPMPQHRQFEGRPGAKPLSAEPRTIPSPASLKRPRMNPKTAYSNSRQRKRRRSLEQTIPNSQADVSPTLESSHTKKQHSQPLRLPDRPTPKEGQQSPANWSHDTDMSNPNLNEQSTRENTKRNSQPKKIRTKQKREVNTTTTSTYQTRSRTRAALLLCQQQEGQRQA